jgi:hypothetical protein
MAQRADEGPDGGQRMPKLMGGIGREADQSFHLALDRLQGRAHHPVAAGDAHQPSHQGADQERLAQACQFPIGGSGGQGHQHVALQLGRCPVGGTVDDGPPKGQAIVQRKPLGLPAGAGGRDRVGGRSIAPAGFELVQLFIEPADPHVGIVVGGMGIEGILGLLAKPGGHISPQHFIVLVVQELQFGRRRAGDALQLQARLLRSQVGDLAMHHQGEDSQKGRDQDPVTARQGAPGVLQVRLHAGDASGTRRHRPFPPDRAEPRRC